MQPKQHHASSNIIDKLKRQVRMLTITSLLFFILAIIAGYLWQKVKTKYNPIIIKSGTIDETMENNMSNAYINNTSGRGYRNVLTGGATDNYHQGVYHRLDTLVSQLTYWRDKLSIDSVDFRFVERVDGSRSFDIIVIPLKKGGGGWPERPRYSYDANDKGTWAFDLGDLHP